MRTFAFCAAIAAAIYLAEFCCSRIAPK